MVIMNKVFILFIAIFLTACSDSNSKPKYGSDSNLAVNCRAYVDEAINYYERETKSYEYGAADLDYYCLDSWNSDSCQEYIYSIQEALEVKDEQAEILTDSLRSHCGLGGDLWSN